MPKVSCPSCRKQSEWQGNPNRPFCSAECRDRDLGNWATERYRVPMHEVEEVTPELVRVPPKAEE